jgi:hypothetical protein
MCRLLFPTILQRALFMPGRSFQRNKKKSRQFIFCYTDRMSLWCNGQPVFQGPARGWYDPGHSLADGFGRVLPDLFSASLPLKAGDNVLIAVLEIKEPEFGSGLWMRME